MTGVTPVIFAFKMEPPNPKELRGKQKRDLYKTVLPVFKHCFDFFKNTDGVGVLFIILWASSIHT